MATIAVEKIQNAIPVGREAAEEAVRAADPSAVFLRPWLLQNLIGLDRGPGVSTFSVPHREIHIISRRRLLELADDASLPLPDRLPGSDSLILLARAEADWAATHTSAELLRHYWRLLFHARIDQHLRAKFSKPVCGRGAIEERIERIGRGIFNEAKFVLERERYLPPRSDDREAFGEFVAVYLELATFRPDLLPVYFPSADVGKVLAAIAEDVDADDLLRQTRPSGAADPSPPLDVEQSTMADELSSPADSDAGADLVRDSRKRSALLARADKAASAGNAVRAALLRMRVSRAWPADEAARTSALAALDTLTSRLRETIAFSDGSAIQWRSALRALLEHSARGWWNAEDRLLYDLQKVCDYHEREIYSVGVVEWLLERCRRPLRRPQPRQRLVLQVKSLRSALRRVARTRLSTSERTLLAQLLHDALHERESVLHESLRPAIADALDAGGVQPRNAVETVAAHKLVAELIDGLTHRGFLTLGNVRDAISRNQLKLDDVPPSHQFLRHDQLLRIDRSLRDALDGVYHRGEFYLRFFQRASSLFFATRPGRFITRTVLLPLGGSFLILEGLDHTLLLLVRKITGWHWLKLSRLDEFRLESFGHFLADNLPFVLLAVILLGVLNWPEFRSAVLRALRGLARITKAILIDAPRWLATRPWLQTLARSREARLALRYVVKPLAFAAAVVLLFTQGSSPQTRWLVFLCTFAAVNLLINSRAGRTLEQAVLHSLRVVGARFTSEVLSNVLRGIMRFFQQRMEDLDRVLYAVDEWLRFRAGQRRSMFIVKAALGVAWFYVAYVTRFAVNLLVEPQINPIKHFPVVTVSHKIVLPTVGLFASGLETLGMHVGRARTMAGLIVTTIPGIFGFLAWELRSNWKLYRANRAPVLKPVQIGSHGETMARLLRPGFHSGTVPKIFAKLRAAQRDLVEPGRPGARARAAAHKQLEAAGHVREAVAYFIEREFIALLNAHPAWRDAPLFAGEIVLGPTRIDVEIACPALGAMPASIFFEQRSGWILAGIECAGWIANTSTEQARRLSAALLGLYKIAGVDVVQEQVESLFTPQPVAFDLTREQLRIWPGRSFDEPITISLLDEAEDDGARPRAAQVLLRAASISWDKWVAAWEPSANEPAGEALPTIRVLPADIPSGAQNGR
ncbi:MAG: hypothetical protein JWL69_1203 [Phycisphaerales bacterium]|nr:hypothetical protein [Phycisphaerales bacterium]